MARKKDASVLVSNQKLASQLSRKLEKRAAAESERLAAFHREPKGKASKNMGKPSESEVWHIELLCMLRLTDRQVTDIVFQGRAKTTGVVAGLIKRRGWRSVQRERVIDRLVEMDRAPARGMEGMVESECAKYRKDYLDAFLHRRGIVPERQVEVERSRLIDRLVNVNASALNAAARLGVLDEWCLLAGFKLQQVQAAVPGGSVGGMNLSGVNVDRGAGDAQLKAMRGIIKAQALADARQAVLDYWKIQMTGPLRMAVIDWVVIRDLPLPNFQFPAGVTESPAQFLNGALEALAHHFDTVPAGVRPRQPTREEWERYDAAMASEGARRRRLFGG